MKTYLLNDGRNIPALGLGTWSAKDNSVVVAIKEAIKCGYRHIDTAMIYGNEESVGQAISECIEKKMVTRDELWVTTKLWNNSHRPEDVEPALRESLKKLNLDYIDLYLVHWPVSILPDKMFGESPGEFITLNDLPLETTWGAMVDLQKKELAKSVGVSNFTMSKLQKLIDSGLPAPAVNQVELHPFLPQSELLEYCCANDVLLTAYSPLGSPGRTEQMKQDNEPDLLGNETVVACAEREGLNPGQLLIAWAIERGTAVIPKSANPTRIVENYAAGEKSLSRKTVVALAGIGTEFRFLNPKSWQIEGVTYEGSGFWD